MTTLKERDLENELSLLKAQVHGETPERHLVRAVFNNVYLGERAGQAGVLIPLVMRASPDNYFVGEVVEIPESEISKAHPWWRRVSE